MTEEFTPNDWNHPPGSRSAEGVHYAQHSQGRSQGTSARGQTRQNPVRGEALAYTEQMWRLGPSKHDLWRNEARCPVGPNC